MMILTTKNIINKLLNPLIFVNYMKWEKKQKVLTKLILFLLFYFIFILGGCYF